MALPVLPAKYYLTHFHEFLEFIEQHYLPVLEPTQVDFITKFKSLSENAQCVYVRMVNRKGVLFAQGEFVKYNEIADQTSAFAELRSHHFVTHVTNKHKLDLIEFYSKKETHLWLKKCNIAFNKSDTSEKLREIGLANIAVLDISQLQDLDQLMVQGYQDELSYLLFLFFGTLQTSLSLYTLRDLGVRQKSQFKEKFKPRYQDLTIAKAEYKLLKLLNELDDSNLDQALEFCQSLYINKNSTHQLKSELLLELANRFESAQPQKAILALKDAKNHPARQNLAKLYYKLDQKEDCKSVLESIIDQPLNDEEILFAEDYLERKFNKKKMGYLTQALRSAEEISLSEAYLKSPEAGVKDYYAKKGITATFTENYLWCGLFGLFFWSEIFENEQTALHNQFERSPADLVGEDFYLNHKEQIENKILLLKDGKKAEMAILKTVAENHGKLNDIFQWHPTLAHLVLNFLKATKDKDVAYILRMMCQNFARYHSGYPDLMIEAENGIQFVEVKAEGDALRAKQLSKLRLLKEAGFEVGVLRVNWVTDPNQVYVVVDIETTGGSAAFHKITEIGAVKMQNGKVIDEFQTLINPGRAIPKYITAITHITNEMVADAPKFSDIADNFFEFTQGAIFVAHNVRFDYGFIQKEFARLETSFVRPQMCTVQGMRKHYPGLHSYSLKNLCVNFNISLEQHHRAMFDAKAAAELLKLIHLKKSPEITQAAPEGIVQDSVVDRHFFE
ncbi:DNA polymerase III subunit epsilon [Bdellovibrio sp. qaytius]|nr:DNA polymerase III subunit epsilon [Bdellovibrio sp. qaytius]